jgi:hypothetical protein
MKAKDNQSLVDISIQNCGGAEAAFSFAKLNGISITDDPLGLELSTPEIIDSSFTKYYADRKIIPATASNEQITEVSRVFFEELPIEFM